MFIYIHTLCLQVAKGLASLRICADSPDPSLLDNVISAIIPCAGSFLNQLPFMDVINVKMQYAMIIKPIEPFL